MNTFVEFRPQLGRVATNLTADTHLREDLLGEMTVFLLENWDRLSPKADLYILRACKHHAIDWMRRGRSVDSKPRPKIEIESLCNLCDGLGVDECLLSMTGTDNDPESILIIKEAIEQTARRLTPIQQEVFSRLLEGHRPADIARFRGVSKPTVSKCIKTIENTFTEVWNDPL